MTSSMTSMIDLCQFWCLFEYFGALMERRTEKNKRAQLSAGALLNGIASGALTSWMTFYIKIM